MNPDSVKFHLGQIVYLVVGEGRQGMITGITFRPTGIMYMVSYDNGNESGHYECELTTERQFQNADN